MGLVDILIGKTVFIDTSPFIYFIEGQSQYKFDLQKVFKANDQGRIKMMTSVITLLEVLVLPLKLNRSDLADEYEKILTASPHMEILQIEIETVKIAAQIRATYQLKTPDAIQIATAIQCNADIFLTNDKDLKRVTELEVITLQS
jgi:predicted nucleic acid-binding protein